MNPNYDALTGLASWTYVQSLLPGILGHNGQVALLMIDLDWMIYVNAEFGPGEGDRRIREVALDIEKSVGKAALVFRLGGDEFGVILYEASLQEAREVAERVRASRQPLLINHIGKEVESLTVSIGIAHFPTHVWDAESLLRAADLALMKAKGEGKHGGRWRDGTPYTPRNRVMAIGDFLDDFPERSAEFLR